MHAPHLIATDGSSDAGVPPIDPRLMDAIRDGNCVAFVGSGFSAAAGLPQWTQLIRDLAADATVGSRELVRSLLDAHPEPSTRELEMAAQLLFDALGEEDFCRRLAGTLRKEPLPEAMRRRLKHLRGIPFRAIVTTNFDPLLPGVPPSAEAYRRLLRPRRPASPWREAIARGALGLAPLTDALGDAESVVVQLHGRLDEAGSLVLTRSQYRRRLYSDPAYLTALRSLLATSTVLFLGYSLTDAYLNELRSELVEAFSVNGATTEPLAWAVIEGVSDVACQYYERHEGLGVVAYRAGANGTDHQGFDAILKAIYDRTNPVHRLGELLRGRRVLWFDPNPTHNNRGRELLRAAASDCGDDGERDVGCSAPLVEALTLDDACDQLSNPPAFDLVVSHWGHGLSPNGRANGEELLRRLSERRAAGTPTAPVIVFAGGNFEADNRRCALRLGAVEFVSRWEDLIAALERVLGATFSRP